MNCSVAREMLGPYVDGELDASAQFQLRLHLSDCESCTATVRRLQALSNMIRSGGLSYEAPAGLETRIRKSIGTHRSAPKWLAWGAMAATIALVSTLSIRVTQQFGTESQLEQELISSHVRAMMTGHTTDVVSTDQHTVKPWFNGRIDFSPRVTDLASHGFPLVGGRVDYLDGRVAAALVYQRRGHVIDVFIWPTRSGDVAGDEDSRGFNIAQWTRDGMSFAAISDLNKTELEQFRTLLATN